MLGRKILRLRLKHELSIGEVAERSGIPFAKMMKAENNQCILSEDELAAVAQVFGLSACELHEGNQNDLNTSDITMVNVLAENNVFAENLEESRQMDLFLDAMNAQREINEYLNSGHFSAIKQETINREEVSMINEKLRESGYYEV